MGRKSKGQKTPSFGMAAEKQRSSKVKRIENYEDTLEEGGVDDFMFKRDQIMFNPRDEGSDEDIADDGEEVMSIAKRQRPLQEEMEVEDEEEVEVQPKKRKEKLKPDVSGKGRFGKTAVDSDEEEDDESGSSGSSSEEEEGWGRQYYSVPSTRREKEKEGEYDEKREEERELEEREVKRLQRKAREALKGEDYGLDDEEVDVPDEKKGDDDDKAVPVPESTDPAVLMRYMEVHEPVKLALAREWPLVVQKLEKTQKGMRALEGDKDGQLHKGLGWLHYQTLLSYASTLAFYLHLTALPPAQRPDLTSHPILGRLLELKKGLSDLEDLDFDAASNSDEDPLGENGWATDEEDEVDEDEEELLQLLKSDKDAMARLMSGEGDEEDDEEAWRAEGLEDDELADLMADAEEPTPKKSKKDKKSKKKATKSATPVFSTLAEPAFFSSKSKSTPMPDDEYDLGDPTSLLDADADDKDRRKRSLAFHTSKIASTANRRAAAREKRMGGDEDIPYRDRQAARDAALRKQTRGDAADAEPLSLRDMTDGEKKRARDVRDDDEGDDYYDLIKRQKTSAKAEKVARHDQSEAERLEALKEIDKAGGEGPRSLTRAIEKNKGLTPRRSKAGRNPRVKKRLAYEKAKQKVGSQRAVYKGGQGSLGGKYAGEKTGISTVVKSRQF